MDIAAAIRLQDVRQKLRTGPWNTGEVGAKGFVVTEPLAADQGSGDNVKRYTDRYLRLKTIGRTADDYAFRPAFLPPELHRAAGLKRQGTATTAAATTAAAAAAADARDAGSAQARLASVVSAVDGDDGADKVDDDDDGGDDEPELEDEFEEMDDDDYNAEKYFDDGDGDDDDGEGEAAY